LLSTFRMIILLDSVISQGMDGDDILLPSLNYVLMQDPTTKSD
jgi:hypothetical protein